MAMLGSDVREVMGTILPDEALVALIDEAGFQQRERKCEALLLLRMISDRFRFVFDQQIGNCTQTIWVQIPIFLNGTISRTCTTVPMRVRMGADARNPLFCSVGEITAGKDGFAPKPFPAHTTTKIGSKAGKSPQPLQMHSSDNLESRTSRQLNLLRRAAPATLQ